LNKLFKLVIFMTLITLLFFSGCQKKKNEFTELKHYPLDSINSVITRSGIHFDRKISSDGKGSLKIVAHKPITIKLFETGEIDVENAKIVYLAKVRSDNLEGQAFLEMWCEFEGKGEFFSKALDSPISGTKDWREMETPFFLKPGQNPSNIRLNLQVKGKGTVWIDDIRLVKTKLE